MVWFKAWTLFTPAEKVIEGCWVLISPPPNRGEHVQKPYEIILNHNIILGSPACVEVRKSKTSGQLVVEFQRQKYSYIHASKLPAEKKYRNGVFTLTAYPVNLSLESYFAGESVNS